LEADLRLKAIRQLVSPERSLYTACAAAKLNTSKSDAVRGCHFNEKLIELMPVQFSTA
jgi:hypothetical protein